MVVDPSRLDLARVRRAFERSAATYDGAAVLQREVVARMAERLDLVKLAPATIVDAGCGTGEALGELRTRHPRAHLIALDFAHNMTLAARDRVAGHRQLLTRLLQTLSLAGADAASFVCADICHLPFGAGGVDLVWSSLAVQWINELPVALAEVHRALSVGGLFMFSTFGPDTLQELRAAFRQVDGATHTSRFIDMHDIGDMLVQAGFADPVMDMERITLTYGDPMAMMRELKAIGAHNATQGRQRGLTGKAGWARMLAALESSRRDGKLPATFEIIYGHAWKPEPKVTREGHAIVRFDRPGRPGTRVG